jgi:hypothetical protein
MVKAVELLVEGMELVFVGWRRAAGSLAGHVGALERGLGGVRRLIRSRAPRTSARFFFPSRHDVSDLQLLVRMVLIVSREVVMAVWRLASSW